MARKDTTREEILSAAADLESAAKALRDTAQVMQDGNLPTVLIHAQSFFNRYLPEILDWSEAVLKDARAEKRAAERGLQSRAAADKVQDDRRKSSERIAKKPK